MLDYLKEKHGFFIQKKVRIAEHHATLQIGVNCWLLWYDNLNYFGLAKRNESKPQGGGERTNFIVVLLPNIIRSKKEADNLINILRFGSEI